MPTTPFIADGAKPGARNLARDRRAYSPCGYCIRALPAETVTRHPENGAPLFGATAALEIRRF